MNKPHLLLGGCHESGEPVAVVRGGDDDGEIIYLMEGSDDEENLIGPFSKREMDLVNQIIDQQMVYHPARLNSKPYRDAIKTLRRTMESGGKVKDPILSDLLKAVKSEFKRKKDTSIEVLDGDIEMLPTLQTRQCVYVAAPSGSGKSYWSKKYAINYNKVFPNNKVFLFSKVDDDISLKGIKNLIPIAIDHQLVDDPIEPDELENSLVIFDDTDTIKDKEIKNAILSLKEDLLETGRHNNIHVLITSHLISNYRDTRTVLNESHIMTIYPNSGAAQQIRYVLRNYWGLGKDDINKILKLNSRAVSIRKNYPMMVFSQNSCYLLGSCVE